MLDFSPEDFKKLETLTPDWYPFKITSLKENEKSKRTGNPMYVIEFKGNGEGAQKDVTLTAYVTHSQKHRLIPILQAAGATMDKSKGAKGIDPQRAVNRVIDIFVGPQAGDDGQEYNTPKQYRPSSQPQA